MIQTGLGSKNEMKQNGKGGASQNQWTLIGQGAFDLWDGWGESVAWVAANRGDFSNGAMAAGYPTGHSYEAFDNMAYSTHVLL